MRVNVKIAKRTLRNRNSLREECYEGRDQGRRFCEPGGRLKAGLEEIQTDIMELRVGSENIENGAYAKEEEKKLLKGWRNIRCREPLLFAEVSGSSFERKERQGSMAGRGGPEGKCRRPNV